MESVRDPIYVLESKRGWKVVYCSGERPMGGEANGNWVLLGDFKRWQAAVDFAKTCRR
jgi:hypothetical protein